MAGPRKSATSFSQFSKHLLTYGKFKEAKEYAWNIIVFIWLFCFWANDHAKSSSRAVCWFLIHLNLLILSKVASTIRFKTQFSSTQPSPPGLRLVRPSWTTMPCRRQVGHTLESEQRQRRQTRLDTIRCITLRLSNLLQRLEHSTPTATSNVSVIKNLKRRAVTRVSTLWVSVFAIDSTKMWWATRRSSKSGPPMPTVCQVVAVLCTRATSSSWRSHKTAVLQAKETSSSFHTSRANRPPRHSPEPASSERVSQSLPTTARPPKWLLIEMGRKRTTWMMWAW